ncbi:DUF3231 family protein [Lysinibacillus sp. SGAir0095]|uniref:DUF3231 family protein n=1 Tax=Lysinibacillus sp. SGAir0095 TaxID=2070463 RepID=UPI0010CD4D6A|nr:DUF3231 family protein [Lysinibacillus sp. SGAir0095]QCR31909.1 hypothetical protein C1N55_06825 [Lysinibacillus sp. SGAir0095]
MPKHVFEALINVFHSLFDEENKHLLHVGEVMSCWTYLTVLEESVALEQLAINTTEDKELNDLLHKTLDVCSSQAARLKVFLQQEGIPLPPASEPKPFSDPRAIPLGAKMTDTEISNLVGVKLAAGVSLCASGAAQSVRNDVGLMFFEFQTELMRYGAILKSIMKKRGWLKVPPYYFPPGNPKS